ncbi:MAG TPA: DUF6599 family protein [Bryobacteraceae bacterium]
MSRSRGVIFGCLVAALSLFAGDDALWREYGLVQTNTVKHPQFTVTTYQMKDATGGLAAWEWQRSEHGRYCDFAAFCTADDKRTIINDENYLIIFDGARPSKAQVEAELKTLGNKRSSSLPPILTFLPREGLTPNSARYILGPESLKAFAPELVSANPGFEIAAEAQVASYRVGGSTPVRMALFSYPTPGMARAHAATFKSLPNVHVKRSGPLVAIVLSPVSDKQADTLLSRVEYSAKITLNETPPPSPIKPLYQLLLNIAYLSLILSGICLLAGLMYAAMRIYRRRYGTLEADEAMTILHLAGEPTSRMP